jgi:uncharacterized protein YfdQ (DUF2303 family)
VSSTNYPSDWTGVMRPRDAEAIIEAARTVATPAELDPEKPLAFVLPASARLEVPDLRAWRSRPTRKTGTYLPATVQSFIEYVNRHYDQEHTTVWVHPSSGQVVAVLDDNAASETGWGDHRAVLTLEPTPEWLFWCRYDGELRTQEAFAEHIEEGMPEIVEPDGATMLELAQNFHATTDATFRSSIRLASGQQQLQYDQEVQATAGRAGDLKVPTMFLLAISPFVGEDPYKVAARLRFRVGGGKLQLGYWLDRPDKVKRDAIEQIAERITEQFPRTYIGSYSG